MKWAVTFPEESILLVRPCLVALCHGNRPAAKLLSVLIYRYSLRLEHKSDAENINEVKSANGETADQDTTFRIYRKQSQLVTDMCDEITEKTLHDVAVPTLQLFGYLDVDESPAIHCYDLHMDIVVDALEAYKRGTQQLEKFLIAHLQLEKFLINKKNFQLNKKNFQLALEKILIANRNSSNNKRGRKPKREAAGEPQSEEPQIILDCLDDSEIGNERSAFSGENATPTPEHLKEVVDEKIEEVEELQRITGEHPAVHVDTETQYPIAERAIGNEERVIAPAIMLPSKAVPANTPPRAVNPRDRQVSPTAEIMETTPARGDQQAPLPSAATPPGSRHGDGGSVQAHSSSPDPAQSSNPPAGTPPAQAPERPKGGKPAVLTLTLVSEDGPGGADVKRWIEEIRGVKVRMTENNMKACNKLADHDGMSKEALVAYFADIEAQGKDVDLLTAAGETGNAKVGFLSFESRWPRLKKKLAKPTKKPGTSDFDIYKGNGEEEREAVYQEGLRRLAEGTLIE